MRMKTQLHEGGKRKGKGMVEDDCFVRWILFVGKGGEDCVVTEFPGGKV